MDSTEVIKQEPKAVVQVASAQGLLEMAITSGADIDKLERLMQLQERYEAKNARSSFTQALGMFQANCPSIKKLKQGHNSKYAPLEDIISQVKQVMFQSGLCYSFSQKQADNQIEVSCHLSHVDGHTETVSMRSEADKSGNKQPIQAIASTVQYLRRYTFTGVTGIVPCDEDSDGRIEKALVIEHCESSQVIKINDLLDETKTHEGDFGVYINTRLGINVMKFSQYTKEQADFAIKQLEAKL
ncbi:MAG: ERF family protein [Planctomycetaceae bacterium]|nr:ERF family protein [Planctomycetaceae bacterium]